MAKIKISYTAPGADVVTAKVNTTPVAFTGTAKAGQSTVTLAPGDYRLNYTVEGLPDTSYTFKIEGSSPDVTLTDTIGSTGLAAGAIPFTVAAIGAAKAAAAITVGAVTAAAVAVGVAAAVRRRITRKKAASGSGKAPKRNSAKRPAAKSSKKTSSRRKSSKKASEKSSKKGGAR
jgi:hypothetical protein